MKIVTSLIYASVALMILSACSKKEVTTGCETPTLTPPSGSGPAGSTVTVTIQTTTMAAYLSWTNDGSQPTPTHGNIVKAPSVQVPIPYVFGRTMRLQAIAFKPGGCVSTVIEGSYVGQ